MKISATLKNKFDQNEVLVETGVNFKIILQIIAGKAGRRNPDGYRDLIFNLPFLIAFPSYQPCFAEAAMRRQVEFNF